ncbi:MAG: winged helix-turn-helix transcriptional regulator [Geobacteraceae bacterium]|nr:winged helix-turn-helix transcriptional regulator [Geobacteraceae bacterium]
MNDSDKKTMDTYRSFLLLSEIEQEESLSQRELASRLGIALGLVNSYLKNLVAKGYIRIKSFPRNRYGYLLTPQGLAEKSRLAYQHLSYFTNLYQVTRQDYLALFRTLHAAGVRQVAFCGVDETAEIAYLSLKETGIKLIEVMDDLHSGENFFEQTISALPESNGTKTMPIIVTSLKRGDALEAELLQRGFKRNIIFRAGNGRTHRTNRSEDL